MSQFKKNVNSEDYKKLDTEIKTNQTGNLYIFHGEEHYLRDRYIDKLRKHVCPDGTDGFNYRRLEGSVLTLNALEDAIDTLPVFAEKTLIEVHDFDLFSKKINNTSIDNKAKKTDKSAAMSPMLRILTNLPDYVCLLFVFNTLPFKPDKRVKINKEIISQAQEINFAVQSQSSLFRWMASHYKELGKKIHQQEAEYLIHITGGYMANLKNEIEKTSAYAKGESITKADIDAVVVPVLDAVVYRLTDAITKREHTKAMKILDDLLLMREAPQKMIFGISIKQRQLLAARICIENRLSSAKLMEMCNLRYEFQAKMLLDTARLTTLAKSRQQVIDCAKAAVHLNSTPDPESRMIELVAKLAM